MRLSRIWKNALKNSNGRSEVQPSLMKFPDHSFEEKIEFLSSQFKNSPDFLVRKFEGTNSYALLYLNGLVDSKTINDNVISPLLSLNEEELEMKTLFTSVTVAEIEKTQTVVKIIDAIFSGKSIILFENEANALILGTEGFSKRSITEPQNEPSIKGAHIGFIESSSENISLIRQFLPDVNLTIKEIIVGKRSKTKVSILFIKDIAHPEIVQELEDRIRKVDTDALINSGELEEFIEDNPFSPFPQFQLTERPDTTVSHLVQGRVAVVVDRTPGVLIGPVTFASFFQTIDDYSIRWYIASFIRLLRFSAFFIAIFLPAFYIASISFHYEIIPLDLILSIGESRAAVPFPPLLEALLMELAIELLRESGLRLPAPVGQTVGVVGGIIIGQAAVDAGIVSNIMVIVVATTAISSFIIPDQELSAAIRLLRFPMMIMAALFGIVGIVISLMALTIHLLSLESLGTPFNSPFAPLKVLDLKDTFVRFPLWNMKTRPLSTHNTNLIKQNDNRASGDES